MGPTAKKFVMPVAADKIWAAAQDMLRAMLNSDIFNLWVAPIWASALEGDQITLEVANDFCEVWLKDNYLGLIQDVLMHASSQPLKVRFKVATAQTGATFGRENRATKAKAVEALDEPAA